MVAGRQLHQQVAGAPVPELFARDLDHAGAVAARDLLRAVGRAGVDHQQLDPPIELLRADRHEHLVEQRAAVQHRQRDGHDGRHGEPMMAAWRSTSRSRSSTTARGRTSRPASRPCWPTRRTRACWCSTTPRGTTCRSSPPAIRTSSSSTPSAMSGTGPATTCWPPGTTRRRCCSSTPIRGSSSRVRSSGCWPRSASDVHAVGPQLVTESGEWDPRDHGELRGFRARVAQAAGSSHYRRRDEPADAAWVSGAACLVLRSAFDAVGGFDPEFFLYKEEEDLFLRIRRAGGRVLYLPSVRVRHDEGAVAARDAHMPASAARFADKHIRSRLQRRVMPRVHRAVAVWGGRLAGCRSWRADRLLRRRPLRAPPYPALHNRYRAPGGEERAVEDLAWLIRTELGEPAAVLERDSSSLGRGRAKSELPSPVGCSECLA